MDGCAIRPGLFDLVSVKKMCTGNIGIIRRKDNPNKVVEFISVADIGQTYNVNPKGLVRARQTVPISEKWVISLSTQYGCPQKCTFCDVPSVGFKGNLTLGELREELRMAKAVYPEVLGSRKLNLHFARMGEPSWNFDVLELCKSLKSDHPTFSITPIVTSMFPRHNKRIWEFFRAYLEDVYPIFERNAGLQVSVNSTDERIRQEGFRGMGHTLEEISDFFRGLTKFRVQKRMLTLNFISAKGWVIDAQKLQKLFPPRSFLVKITPLNGTRAAIENQLDTAIDFNAPTGCEKEVSELEGCGYKVLVSVPSLEEESGNVCCGQLAYDTLSSAGRVTKDNDFHRVWLRRRGVSEEEINECFSANA